MPPPLDPLDEFQFWVQRIQDAHNGTPFTRINEPGQNFLDFIGVTIEEWNVRTPHTAVAQAGGGGERGLTRWNIVRDRLYGIYGITEELFTAARGQGTYIGRGGGLPALLSLDDLNAVVLAEIQLQIEAGNEFTPSISVQPTVDSAVTRGPLAPPTLEEWQNAHIVGPWPGERQPAGVRGGSYEKLGESWLREVRKQVGGEEIFQTLRKGKTFIKHDVIGQLLATGYAGGDASLMKELMDITDDEELSELIAYRMGSTSAQKGLHDFFVMQGEKFTAEFMADVVEREIEAQLDVTADNPIVAEDIRKSTLSFIRQLWGKNEGDEVLEESHKDIMEIRDSILNGNMRQAWDEIVQGDPELQDTIDNTDTLPDLSDAEIDKLIEQMFPNADNIPDPIEMRTMVPKWVEIEGLHRALERGTVGQTEFNYRLEVLKQQYPNAWEAYDNKADPVVPTSHFSSLEILGKIEDNLIDWKLALNPLADPESIKAEVFAYVNMLSGDPEFGLIDEAIGGAETNNFIFALERKGAEFNDAVKAVNYIESDRKTTTNFKAFQELVGEFFTSTLGVDLENIPFSQVEAVATGTAQLWAWFLIESESRGATKGMQFVLDPATWISDNFGEWVSDVRAGVVAADVTGQVTIFDTLFEKELKAIEEVGTSLEAAEARNLTFSGQVMWALGVDIGQADKSAQSLFQPFKEETADAYFERVGANLLARAKQQQLLNPAFDDSFGFLAPDADTRSIVEGFGRQIVPEVVYTAEVLGLTIGEVLRRREAAKVGAVRTVDRTSPVAQSLARTETQDFLEVVVSLTEQLPIAQQAEALEAAILAEETLREEFEAQLPKGPEGEPLTGKELREERKRLQRDQTDALEHAAIGHVAKQFGISREEAERLAAEGALGATFGDLQTLIEQEAELAAGRGELPDTTIYKEIFKEVIEQDEETGEDIVIKVPTGEFEPTGEQAEAPKPPVDSQALEVAKAVQEQRQLYGATQPGIGTAFTFPEFVRRQPPSRFRSTLPIISPQLRTRRVG